jgi:hypothetical protein
MQQNLLRLRNFIMVFAHRTEYTNNKTNSQMIIFILSGHPDALRGRNVAERRQTP